MARPLSIVSRFISGPSSRLSAGLALITVCLVLTADLFGLLPNSKKAVIEARAGVIEQSASIIQQIINRDGADRLDGYLSSTVTRNSTLDGLIVKTEVGEVVAIYGDVSLAEFEDPNRDFASVAIRKDGERWGAIGYQFKPFRPPGVAGWLFTPVAKLLYFLAAIGYCFYAFFLRKVLQHLDPTAIMPQRVRTIMDTLTEGTVLIDADFRIIMANLAFARMVEYPIKELTGTKIGAFDWTQADAEQETTIFLPWDSAIGAGAVVEGRHLSLSISRRGIRHYVVNVAPIFDTSERCKGALITFDDRTEMVRTHAELKSALAKLEEQQEAIERQNEELKHLATRDPLTSCLNRRAFFEIFEKELLTAKKRGQALSCIMCDIDHFKSVNDTYGHATGDKVIQIMANTVKEALRDNDHLCRYGGEEFCVVMPGTTIKEAAEIAERMRAAVEKGAAKKLRLTGNRKITSSFGVSTLSDDVDDLHKLIEFADQALYVSKDNGRNQVSVFKDPNQTSDGDKVVSLA